MIDSGDTLRPNSRYNRRPLHRRISWIGLLLGVLMGVGVGLYAAWYVNPVVEENTRPEQLRAEDRADYLVAIALSFAHNSDLGRATSRILSVLPPQPDPIAEMANVACDLARSGYVNDSSGLNGVRSLMNFYQLQGRSGCADELVTVNRTAPTPIVIAITPPTNEPPVTKTPTPALTQQATPTPVPVIVPTTPPQQQFALVNVATFCDVEQAGVIEVFVQDFNGNGLPGEAIRVRWDGGQDVFYTGLKPERGPAYADFQMEANVGYTVEMPGRSDPSTNALVAVPCTTAQGDRSVTSYRAVFRPTG